MIVHVLPDGVVRLDDPDSFTAFSVRAPGRDAAQAARAIDADAQADDDGHVWIPLDRLYTLGAESGGADWRSGCDGMIAYATGKGWVDESGRRVRAHLED